MSDDSHTITFVSRKTFKPLSNMLVTKISKRDKPELEDMGILKIISDREAKGIPSIVRIGYGYSKTYTTNTYHDTYPGFFKAIDARAKYANRCYIAMPACHGDVDAKINDRRGYVYGCYASNRRLTAYIVNYLEEKYGMIAAFDGYSGMFRDFGYKRELILIDKELFSKIKVVLYDSSESYELYEINADNIEDDLQIGVCTLDARIESECRIPKRMLVKAVFLFDDVINNCIGCYRYHVGSSGDCKECKYIEARVGVAKICNNYDEVESALKKEVIDVMAKRNKSEADSVMLQLKI